MWSGHRAEMLLLPAAAVGLAVAAWRDGRAARRGVLAVATVAVLTMLFAFAYSRYGSPAWALRYLVVVLAPLAVLVGLGLGRLPVLGAVVIVATVVLAWHGHPSSRTLENKSNVTQVARTLGPALPRGTLVFSTQPEQVPELDHELPPGMRFATPLGAVADPGVMDWRDALTRLRAARYATALRPVVQRLPRGTRVLLVQPDFGHPDSPWTVEIRKIARRWGRLLRRDAQLRRVRVVRPTRHNSRSTVTAFLMERR
jgi:hypothetical protein